MNKNRYKYLKKLNDYPSRYEAGSIKARFEKTKEYNLLVDEVIKEVELNKQDSRELKYLINQTENISDYYRRNCKGERILIAIALLIKKKNNIDTVIEEHKAYTDYKLDISMLLTISIKLSRHYQKYSLFATEQSI